MDQSKEQPLKCRIAQASERGEPGEMAVVALGRDGLLQVPDGTCCVGIIGSQSGMQPPAPECP